MRIHSDKTSEKFRKYIIGFKIKNITYYAIWGTDMTNEDFDFLVLNNNNSIICSMNIETLKDYLKSNINGLVDSKNLYNWLKYHKAKKAYTIYDLDRLKSIFSERKYLFEKIGKRKRDLIFNFVTVFSDYIQQIKNEEFQKILKQKLMQNLFYEIGADYVNIDLQEKKNIAKNNLNSEYILMNINLMINFLAKSLKRIDY